MDIASGMYDPRLALRSLNFGFTRRFLMTVYAYDFIAFQSFLVVQRSLVFYSFSALNKNAPQPQRATLDFEQNLSDTVSSTSTQVLNLLTTHGCVDITPSIDLSLCSNNPVATGGSGDIFVGRLRTGTRVAIKVFRSYGESNELAGKYHKAAAREIHTWSKCQHPNIVELIGLTVFRECLAMVSEWEDNGNMLHYLSRNPTVNRCELVSRVGVACLYPSGVLTPDSQSKSICAGVLYLHSMDIANVLIDRNGAPRLTDFGCASFLSTTLHFTQTNTGPSYSVRWTVSWGQKFSCRWVNSRDIITGPGDTTRKTGHTKEGDIYALGMEAFTTEVPFSGRSEISLYRHVVDRKKTPQRPGASYLSGASAGRPTAQAVHTLASQMLPLSPELLDVIAEEPEDDDDD
ncbi:kinase-like protein [Rhizoctonia solani]|uniref:Kinase-like protein n=1 Tax=Rhizoctonia solani TaxID=456999 RepID=A0A8H7I540_9AGAM|nr:kinase-like protein [Rhizoctonia solani]